MNNNQTNTQMLLSIIVTFIIPIIGVISLYYAITARSQWKNHNDSYTINLSKAYKWAKISAISAVALWIIWFFLLIGLYAYNH